MRRLLVFSLILCCLANALQYSHRIRALGTDFANLIPDYETDLYRNPQLLDKGIVGISYEPTYIYVYRLYEYLPVTIHQMPVKLRLMTERLGMMGQYWMHYSHDLEPSDYGWQSSTYKAFRIQDVWMHRIRDAVINLYNDLDYSKVSLLTSTNAESIENRIEYIAKTQVSLKIRKRLNLDLKIGYGFYESSKETDRAQLYKQRINLGLARIGFYCGTMSGPNDFTTWYIDIGSPLTNTEIDSLPYSIFSSLGDDEHTVMWFARTLLVRLGFAKSLLLSNRAFAAVGVRNAFLYQNTDDATEATDLRGIKNTLSMPLAFEYGINDVALRLGTRLRYDFKSLREADDNALSGQSIQHELTYDYSFGIGWQPHKNLVLDIYNNGNLWCLRDWAIYVKYLF